MSAALIPPVYLAPLGLPLYWGNDVTGEMPAAVRAYHGEVLGEGPMTLRQLELVCAYCVHHIGAPCWLEKHPSLTLGIGLTDEYCAAIAGLRAQARGLKMVADIGAYIAAAMELGLDPL